MSIRIDTHAPLSRAGEGPIEGFADEETATFAMWLWPELLGWPSAITWLFAPAVWKPHRGDLWSVDAEGRLLLVETKLQRQRGVHPLKSLEECSSGSAPQDAFGAARLMADWVSKFEKELKFQRKDGISGLAEGQPPSAHPGVLPYSTHREANWRWQRPYQEMILPQFDSGEYQARVTAHLGFRKKAHNPAPVFVGLLATVRDGEPSLNTDGWSAWQRMQLAVGAERVHMRAVRLRPTTPSRVTLEGWAPVLEQSEGRKRRGSRDNA